MQTLTTRTLRTLDLVPGHGPAHLSAASGLLRSGPWLYVAADDELGLGCFGLDGLAPGTLRRLVPTHVPELPLAHDARKARKPDTEALLRWPALHGCAHGALMAVGSGSRPNRQQGALWALDAQSGLLGAPRALDLAPLYAPLHQRFGELNIEGAFVEAGSLVLLQRGHRDAPVNASIRFSAAAVAAWLVGQGDAPAPQSITEHRLGALGDVPLGFTDGAALPGGGWLYSAAAEDTGDAYLDGACTGSAIGRVDAAGAVVACVRLEPPCKVEGLALAADGDARSLLLVTDADDRAEPAQLLAAQLPSAF